MSLTIIWTSARVVGGAAAFALIPQRQLHPLLLLHHQPPTIINPSQPLISSHMSTRHPYHSSPYCLSASDTSRALSHSLALSFSHAPSFALSVCWSACTRGLPVLETRVKCWHQGPQGLSAALLPHPPPASTPTQAESEAPRNSPLPVLYSVLPPTLTPSSPPRHPCPAAVLSSECSGV